MNLRVMTFNCNGIRAAKRKGFFEWFLTQDIDVLCLQETKAQMQTLYDDNFALPGYNAYFSDAIAKGYSGVGIYTRRPADNIRYHLNDALSKEEGRFIMATIEGIDIASMYFPSGTSGEKRQANKMLFLDTVASALLQTKDAHQQPTLLVGDWNIAHQNIDLKNWRSNQKNSGFLPEERAWVSQCIESWGWVDVFRSIHPEKEQYTWWTYRAGARERNVGWRIDYHWVNQPLKGAVVSAVICDDAPVFSDHAPMVVDYAL